MDTVKLSDVARLAGVSTSTVSRVLSSSRPVSARSAVAVQRAAAELGYTGNSIARALRMRTTDTIGMVVPSILNPFFTTLVDSMEQTLHSEGKQLLLCDSRQDPSVEASRLISLIERHVDGIVVSPCDETLSQAAVARVGRSVPLVQLDRRTETPELDWVGVDDDLAMGLVVEHLSQRGARYLAYVGSDLANSSNQDRLAGVRRHAARLRLALLPEWVIFGEFSAESGLQAGRRLLDANQRPDAIVCANDLIAFGVLRACRERGVAVPGEVMVTGYDNLDFGELTVPTLTTVEQPTTAMADEVMRLLDRRAGRPGNLPGTRVALAPHLVVRDSTGKRSTEYV